MVSTADEFRALVLAEAEDDPNPHRVTTRVLAALADDPAGLRVALELALGSWVRDFLKRPHVGLRRELNERPPAARPEPARPATAPPAARPVPIPAFSSPPPISRPRPPAQLSRTAPSPTPPLRRAPVVHVDGEGHRRASAKTVAVVDWHTEAMRQSVKVSARKDDWRTLGKCTADDLAYMAAERRRMADLNKAQAERYEQLRKLLKESPTAVFVEQLPKTAVEPILRT